MNTDAKAGMAFTRLAPASAFARLGYLCPSL